MPLPDSSRDDVRRSARDTAARPYQNGADHDDRPEVLLRRSNQQNQTDNHNERAHDPVSLRLDVTEIDACEDARNLSSQECPGAYERIGCM